jgi:hypothetical protein
MFDAAALGRGIMTLEMKCLRWLHILLFSLLLVLADAVAIAGERSRLGVLIERFAGIPCPWKTIADVAVGHARTWALLGLLFVAIFQMYFEVGNTSVEGYIAANKEFTSNAVAIESDKSELERLNASLVPAQAQPAALSKKIADSTVANQLLQEQIERKLSLIKNMLFWIDWPGQSEAKDSVPVDEYDAAQRIISVMEGVVIVLRDFVLPMGWGFLGAALYVSRSLAEDIRTVAYAPDRAIIYRSRYYMGMVAGFVVAKFFVPLVGAAGSSTITPLAFALLVGYSVEVLFTLFDKIIGAFSAK